MDGKTRVSFVGYPMSGSESKKKIMKICGVCGDSARNYNFGAISCQSCKAFFRRNALKGMKNPFKCQQGGTCKYSLDSRNRKYCKSCRLDKCIYIGMKVKYILTEQEKAIKLQKIEENRMLRKQNRQHSLSSEIVSSQTSPLKPKYAELFEELQNAYRCSQDITIDSEPSRENAKSINDLVNIAEISARRVVEMAKNVKSFKALQQYDQIALLKGGCIELLILRSVISFDTEKQHFLDPGDNEDTSAMNMDQMRIAVGGQLLDHHMKFVRSMAIELKADQETMVLLLFITLFSPDRFDLRHKELVSDMQENYSDLLRKYLESRFPSPVSNAMYPKLLMKLTDIRSLKEDYSGILRYTNRDEIKPLMQEFLIDPEIEATHRHIQWK